jgi:hypothetical protein
MIIYKILVKNGDEEPIGEFQTFQNLRFGKKLNNYSQCTFQIPVEDPKAESLIALRRFSVWVYRITDTTNTLLWSGEQALREGNLDDKGDNWATITCYTWLEKLNSRFTASEVIFSAVDAGEIAWELIDTTQSQTHGDIGITQGTIETTMDRDRTYNNQNVSEAIINLSSAINGFDHEITDLKVFNVQSFIGVDRTADLVLEYGYNVRSVRITEDFSKPINRSIVLGNSGDFGSALRVERNDTASQAIYLVEEGIINEMTASELTTLQEKGDALMTKYGAPLIKLSLGIVRSTTPTIIDFALGDIIRVKIKSGIYDIDESFRVFEWTVDYDKDNTETLNLVLGNFNIPA